MIANLYDGRYVRLDAIKLDKDPQVISQWTYGHSIARIFREEQPFRPLATFEIKEYFEEAQKDKSGRKFPFAVRSLNSDALVGILFFSKIEWPHGVGCIELAIGPDTDWEARFEDSLLLGLRYAFMELNLYHLSAWISAYDTDVAERYARCGFRCEVTRRQVLYKDNRRWDQFLFAILRKDWQNQHNLVSVSQSSLEVSA